MSRLVQTLIATAASVTLVAALAVAEGDHGGDDRFLAATWGKRAPAATTVAVKGDRQKVARLVVAEASRQQVPHTYALAIAQIESGFRCEAVGPRTRHGRAHGPLQILPSSAARLGYSTTDLASCGNGLAAGMSHLADCYRRASGDPVKTAACHVGGPGMATGPRGDYARRYVRLFQAALAQHGG